MNTLTLILPIAMLGGLLLFFGYWLRTLRAGLSRAGGLPRVKRERNLTRVDAFLAAVLTLLYGVVAFLGLGDLKAPVSRYEFADWGSTVTIELPEGTRLGALRWYAGVRTGNCFVYLSTDGGSYADGGRLAQDYVSVLNWKDWHPDALELPVRKLQLVADAPLDVAELAIYDADGTRLEPELLRYDEAAEALFDEQALVPEDGGFRLTLTDGSAAHYDRVIEINLSTLNPLIACPHSPDNVVEVASLKDVKVDQVCIGSCTNSSLYDMLKVAAILKGKTIAPGVSLSISPGSRQVLTMLSQCGALNDILASGARLLECACGP